MEIEFYLFFDTPMGDMKENGYILARLPMVAMVTAFVYFGHDGPKINQKSHNFGCSLHNNLKLLLYYTLLRTRYWLCLYIEL